MTEQETARIIGYLSEAFRTEMSEPEIVIWNGHLSDLGFQRTLEAAHACVRTLTFFPKIAELLEAYKAHSGRVAAPYHRQAQLPPAPTEKLSSDEAKARFAAMRAGLGRVGRGTS